MRTTSAHSPQVHRSRVRRTPIAQTTAPTRRSTSRATAGASSSGCRRCRDDAVHLDHRSGALQRRVLAGLHGLLDVSHGLSHLEGSLEFDAARPAASSVVASIAVASVDVTNERLLSRLMDADLLGGKDHPTITFRSTRVEAVDPTHWKVTGD